VTRLDGSSLCISNRDERRYTSPRDERRYTRIVKSNALETPRDSSLPLSLTFAGFVTFVLMGLLQAMFGPALFSIRSSFHVDVGTANFLLSAFFVGNFMMILANGALEKVLSKTNSLLISAVLLTFGSLGLSLAPSWNVLLACAFLTGLGYGGGVLNFNTLFASGFGSRGTAMVSLLNAAWSVGAILGPILIGNFLENFRVPFLLTAIVAGLMIPLAFTARQLESAKPSLEVQANMSGSSRIFWPWILGFAVMFLLYVGAEVGAGANEPRHLHDAFGMPLRDAAFFSSLFWFGGLVARVLVAPISLRVPAPTLVLICLIGMSFSLALAHVPVLAPYAYAACGLFTGPIFPSALSWFTSQTRASLSMTSWILASANFGGVIFPPIIAGLTAANAAIIPTVLLVFTVANAVLAFTLGRLNPRV
jgi:MFS transporter, FHS family, glucose/mannose:H+ symporter